MKPILHTLAALALCIVVAQAEKVTPGPKGGRLLEGDPPRAEFFVETNHHVTITFYDASLKVVPAGEQVVTAVAETGAGKIKIEFEKKGDALVSKIPLPAGDGYNVVLQLRASADAKPKNFRIPLNMANCGGCNRAEYACTCDH